MDFLNNSGVLIYFFIFFGKILEVTVSTVRVVLINRGEKKIGSLIALIEILLWLFITGTVLEGFQEDWLRVVVFALAFAIGNYLGSSLESKLAFGYCSIQIIAIEGSDVQVLIEQLRANNFAVTKIKGQGKDGERDVLILHLLRKRIPIATQIVEEHLNNAFMIINDVQKLHGGYIKK